MAKKKNEENNPPDLGESQDTVSEEIPEVTKDGTATEPPKKRRGRPPGSKNKKSGETKIPASSLPPEMLGIVALLPLQIPTMILAKTKGIVPVVNPQFVQMLPMAFGAWLDSVGFNLTPGWTLIGLYCAAMATAQYRKVDDLKAKSDAKPTVDGTANPEGVKPVGSSPTVTA